MTPLIFASKRAKCRSCGGIRFVKSKSHDFTNLIPSCTHCGGRPDLFRVIFKVPKIGTDKFSKIERIEDHKGSRLDTPSKADSFCEYLKEKLSVSNEDFDPRVLGTKEEREFFILKNNKDAYLKHHRDMLKLRKLTPAGYAKKERVMRLYITELLGEFSVKEITFQVINKSLVRSKLTDASKTEMLKELSVYFGWCCMEGLIRSKPELPKIPKQKKLTIDSVYSFHERNLVIRNITFSPKHKAERRKHQIAIMILAAYAGRKSEVLCLRWSDINFKTRQLRFARHLSSGKGVTEDQELTGLKSSPDKTLTYDFFPGLLELLMELGPKMNSSDLVFQHKDGGYLPINTLYDAWKKSAEDLISKDKLSKYVDLHRGLRSSTLTAAQHAGFGEGDLGELYGGDLKTMNDHYVFKKKQDISGLLKFSSSFSTELAN